MFTKAAMVAALALAATCLPSSTQAWPMGFQNGYPVNQDGIIQIGKNEPANIEVAAGVSREDVLSYPNADYISVRFDSFHLPEGDEVVVRSPDFSVIYTYTNKGRADAGAFYATYIPGDTAIVQYIARTPAADAATATTNYGYKIPVFARGFTPRSTLAVCGGGDQTVPAKCFTNGTNAEDLPLAYERSKAVARLLINGTSLCTGWLAGSEGHLITNRHCIKEASLADNTDIEFDAESTSCEDECKIKLGCKGTVVTKVSKFITNSDLDYALLQLPASVDLKKYGYLQLRASGAELGEAVYIPQHPVGYAKRIASLVEGGYAATIQSLYAYKSCGKNQVGYSADTQGGSSGSPVLAWSDNTVVSLHHCGGCENQGVDILDVIADLKSKNIEIKDLLAPTPAPTPSA